jgi:threonyl-tRNA synthetase
MEVYVYALPAGVIVGTNEAIAWEALMSPVGEYAASAMYQAVIDEFGQVEPYVTIRAAEERKIPYMLIVGEKEKMEGTVSVRRHKRGNIGSLPFSEFISLVSDEIRSKRNPDQTSTT